MPNEQQNLIPQETLGDWMVAVRLPDKPNSRTCRWAIHSKLSEAQLGTVSWYGAWRCYVFHPASGTLFNSGCLELLARFCQRHRNTRQEVDDGN